jgi:hypothetical protein
VLRQILESAAASRRASGARVTRVTRVARAIGKGVLKGF